MVRPCRSDVASVIDHTLLKPEATQADITACVTHALDAQVFAVCVSPSMVETAARAIAAQSAELTLVTVAGFPSGKHLSVVKAQEAALAVDSGAAEIDMVIDVGAALAGDIRAVADDIAAVRAAIAGAVLKVIVESAALLHEADESTLVAVCSAAVECGADFVKTSTGFHPAGGASVRAVELMAATVASHAGVKASGGIRTADQAVAMLAAGATRLGLSNTRAVLNGLSAVS